MTGWIIVFLVLLAEPWKACQSVLPEAEASREDGETSSLKPDTLPTVRGTAPIPSGSLHTTATSKISLATKVLLSPKLLPTDRPPTLPLKPSTGVAENDTEKRKLGAYYRTVYMGNATKGFVYNTTTTATTTTTTTTTATAAATTKYTQDNITKTFNQSHINMQNVSMTTVSYQEDVEKIPWHQGHTHHNTKHTHRDDQNEDPTERTGPYFRPPSAISHKYKANSKQFRVDPDQSLEEIDPDCWPHCKNSTRGNKRKRKHSSFKKRKYYNYKLLYDTLKGDLRRQETEFYAWIFGATMLTLGSLTTLTSCFVFCFCSEKWKKRRQRRRFDKSGQYQRVDSVSSMVDSHVDPQEHQEQMDSVTII